MTPLHRQPICVASVLLVPLLKLAAPSWLTLEGVPPSWAILWLLPWSLVDGPVAGVIAGAGLGMVLDGLSLGDASQVPALMLMGWWWGRLGRRGQPIQRSLNLGLLAWIGSVALGLSLIVQVLVVQGGALDPWLVGWAWKTTWSQSLITALLAPMLVSIQLLIWRRKLLTGCHSHHKMQSGKNAFRYSRLIFGRGSIECIAENTLDLQTHLSRVSVTWQIHQA